MQKTISKPNESESTLQDTIIKSTSSFKILNLVYLHKCGCGPPEKIPIKRKVSSSSPLKEGDTVDRLLSSDTVLTDD